MTGPDPQFDRRRPCRSTLVTWTTATCVAVMILLAAPATPAQIAGGTLSPDEVDKYPSPLAIPPAMPRAGKLPQTGDKNIDYKDPRKPKTDLVLPVVFGVPAEHGAPVRPSRRFR